MYQQKKPRDYRSLWIISMALLAIGVVLTINLAMIRPLGYLLLGVGGLGLVWSLALLGIALQVMVPARTRHLSVPLSLVMGWVAVIAIEPLARSLHPEGLALLVAGGVAYTLGVVFYAWRRLPFNHAVWHAFVMADSACHF